MARHLSVPPLGLDAIANTDGPEYAKIIIPRSCIGTPHQAVLPLGQPLTFSCRSPSL
jgi:hypothetical protein